MVNNITVAVLDGNTDNSNLANIPTSNVWLRVLNYDTEILSAVCDKFNLHKLTLEDIESQDHQPKYEDNEDYSLCILRSIHGSISDNTQIAIVLSDDFLITFGERESSFASKLYKSILKADNSNHPYNLTKIRYLILDNVIDQYLDVAHLYEDRLFEMTEELEESPNEEKLYQLFELRREMNLFRRTIRPVQDMVEKIYKSQSWDESQDHIIYWKDLLDHINRANSYLDQMVDSVNSLQSEVLTLFQYSQNRTMKLMTTVSVIFLPLMFITGIYGMNFDNMPELKMAYGYPAVMLLLLALGVGLSIFFSKRRMM